MSELLPKSIMIHIPTTGDMIGTTVSSMVYSALTTTGDVTATATQTGMDIAGQIIGYGTEMMAGPIAGNTVRAIASAYGSATKHAITKSSRIGAISLSILAYTGAALTTTALIRSGNAISTLYYMYNKPGDIELKQM